MNLDQKIQVWNAVGTWLAAIGTIAAVIASLYLASRPHRSRLQTSLGLRTLVGGGFKPTRYVILAVTNVGDRTVTVTTIGWQIGLDASRWKPWRPKPRFAMQSPDGHPSDQVPKVLQHGETANFMLRADDWVWIEEMRKYMLDETPKIELRHLRGIVSTSIGERFKVQPEKTFLEWFDKESRHGQKVVAAAGLEPTTSGL